MKKYIKILLFFGILFMFVTHIKAQYNMPSSYQSTLIPDPNAVFNALELGGQWKPESIDNYTSNPNAVFPVLIVYAEFYNDPGPDYEGCPWHVGEDPTFMGTLIAQNKSVNNEWWNAYNENGETLSDYWMEVSRGELHLVGQEVHVILPHTSTWYETNGSITRIMDDMYDELANNSNIYWPDYDKWSKDNGYWEYARDGYLDMMYIIFRSRPDNVGLPNGGQTPMPGCSHTSGHVIYDEGGIQVKIYPSLSSTGSGFLNTPGWGSDENGYFMYAPFGKEATMGLSQHEHSHYLFGVRSYSFLGGHQQYGKVNNYHGWDYFLSPYEMIRLGYITTRKVDFAGTPSYSIDDFSSRYESEILEVPIGDANRNEFFLITHRMKESNYDRLMFGDTAHGDAFRNINPEYGKGLYIYHAYPGAIGSGYQWQVPFDNECADGLYNWVQDGYQHPDWSCTQNVEYYKRTSVVYDMNDNGGEEYQQMYNHDGKSIYTWFGIGEKEYPLCKNGDGTDRIYTNSNEVWTSREWQGDRWDAWKVGYNEVFSPYSSPSTVNWDNEQTGIFIYLESQNGNTANLKIYKSGEGGWTEDEILEATPPSKPMIHQEYSIVECNDGCAKPQIIWENSKEPDMLRDGDFKRYRILSAYSNGALPVQYFTIGYYNDYTPNDTASFIDRINPCIDCSGGGENQSGYYRYKVQAIDKYDNVSVFSDFVSVNAGWLDPDNFINPSIPEVFALSQNYPNPFNPSTEIRYSIPANGFVRLKVYNLLGEEIAVLVNEYKNQGEYNVTFDGSNLASGVYFYKLELGSYIATKKMVLIK